MVDEIRPKDKTLEQMEDEVHGVTAWSVAASRHSVQLLPGCPRVQLVSSSCPSRVHLVSISCPSRVHLSLQTDLNDF